MGRLTSIGILWSKVRDRQSAYWEWEATLTQEQIDFLYMRVTSRRIH